jgi:light-regulated signal transduction histidine kinase (bacteriophytochrome)
MVGDKGRKSASLMFAPLFTGNQVIGVISVQSYTLDAYTPDDMALLVGIGHHAAIAIENARLYAAVQQELLERQRAEEAVRRLNAELEVRVAERTAELEASNRDLESFAYSASHDLRTPLHIIAGFSRILEEEYQALLPAEAIDYLRRIQANTRRMNTLIDQLLSFSRFGSQALAPRPISAVRVRGLVQSVIDEVHATAPERRVVWQHGLLEGCMADPGLLRQIWVNLLGNAFKYTRGRDPAIIRVVMAPAHDMPVYMVQDNGVGFDMHQAEKLFGVFQRLHPADEFEGSGVGLALVKRIVDRHGGRIWVEAIPGQGATFFFSLPAYSASDESWIPGP